MEETKDSKIIKNIKILEIFANLDICDGSCDELYPYEKCIECSARSLLNEIWEETNNWKREFIIDGKTIDEHIEDLEDTTELDSIPNFRETVWRRFFKLVKEGRIHPNDK